ncbi:MAG: hypothetical protein LBT27_07030 [Prevotellaceae bacterium]|jgi:hypothetical protein|nr:hypothetical protein [Prevotellaceae bacterium]
MEILSEIKMPHGANRKIGKLFDISQPTLRKYLRGTLKDSLSNKVRKAAIENGGKEYVILDETKK